MTRRAFLRGVRVRVTPNEPESLSASLVASATGARIARARSFNLTLRRVRRGRSAKTRVIVLRPRRSLVGHARRFHVELVVVGTNASGAQVTVTRRLTIVPRAPAHHRKHRKGRRH